VTETKVCRLASDPRQNIFFDPPGGALAGNPGGNGQPPELPWQDLQAALYPWEIYEQFRVESHTGFRYFSRTPDKKGLG